MKNTSHVPGPIPAPDVPPLPLSLVWEALQAGGASVSFAAGHMGVTETQARENLADARRRNRLKSVCERDDVLQSNWGACLRLVPRRRTKNVDPDADPN